MMLIAGWFESECGAVPFHLHGSDESDLAAQMVAKFGEDCQGVDREVDGPDGFSSTKFWRLVDADRLAEVVWWVVRTPLLATRHLLHIWR